MKNTETKEINSYKDLIVWQKAMELVKSIYELTTHFPKEEIYGLSSQMKRSSISIPSNIAEGRRRGGRKELNYFLLVSYGSGAELETQLEIAKSLSFGKNLSYTKAESLLSEVMKMLNKMLSYLKTSQPS